MSGRYLLDTNIIIALFADEAGVKANLVGAEEVFIPSVVIGECAMVQGSRAGPRRI